MPEIAGLDKKQWIYVAVGGGALGLWYLHKKSSAAASGTSAAATDSGSVDTGPTGGAADAGYPYGGFGASSGGSYTDTTGGAATAPGNYANLPPVTGNSAGSTAPSPSTRTVSVQKGETQSELIQAAGETYADFLKDNPKYGTNGKSNGVKVKAGDKVVLR